MRKTIVTVIICFLLSIHSMAFCQTGSDTHVWSGNINLFLGAKILDDDWEPIDEHAEVGVLLDLKHKKIPLSIALDLFYSEKDKDIGVTVLGFGTFDTKVEAQTIELNIGVRKIWENFTYVRPFIGGGLAFIGAEFEASALGESVSVDDEGIGAWIDFGIYVTLSQQFNIGIDARWSKAEVDLFGVDSEAGGWHIGALIGYHW
jgi:hypothetical protein